MEPIHDSSYEAILHPARQLLILATAGSGKTFALTHRVRATVLDGVRPDRVLCLTFTRKAAAELKERLKGLIGPAAAKKIVAGTFHAIALRILKKSGEKFTVCNEEEARGILRRMLEERGQPAEWAAGLQEEIGRRKLIAAVPAMDAETRLDAEIPLELVEQLSDRYQAELSRAGKKDYDDLLVQTLLLLRAEPGRAEGLGFRAIYVDEVQDTNRIQMEIVQRLATPVTCVTCVGDLDQCQPEGTRVSIVQSTGNRWHEGCIASIPIEEIQVGDRVVSYSPEHFAFLQSGRLVKAVSSREYSGDLIVLETQEGHRTRCTPNHRCYVDFEPLRDKYAVYLMSKDGRFRIGKSKLDYGLGASSGPRSRMRHEQADALWILDVYDTDIEARTMEAAIAGRFGIPQLCFLPCGGKRSTKMPLEKAWKLVGRNFERGVECLRAFGRDPLYPLATKEIRGGYQYFSLKRPGIFYACNLISGCEVIPYRDQAHLRKSERVSIQVTREHYKGKVYSLEVEEEQLYIADGIVTHNSIFSFQRADPEVVLSLHTYFPAIETLYLSQNRRCSGNITHASAALIRNNTRRRDHPISTPNPDGALIRLVTASDRRQEVESVVREIQIRRREGVPYREMAVLYRNNYQSETIENRLVVEQLPYTIGGGRFSYFQRPAIKAAVCGLRLLHDATDEPARKYLLQTPLWASRPERGQELDQALDSLRPETGGPLSRLLPQTLSRLRLWMPVRGVLAAAAVPPEPYRSLLEVGRSFESLETFLGYSQEVPAREGADAVSLLTIHCAKGKEFDVVFLIGLEDGILPDHRARTLAEVEEERRVKFVAMTRAKRQLVLSHAQYRERPLGDREWRRRSRFLDEIPGDYLEHRVLEDLYDGGRELVELL